MHAEFLLDGRYSTIEPFFTSLIFSEDISVAPMFSAHRGAMVSDMRGGHRRGEVEIMRDVLEVCLRGANKTKIVYGANLNFSRLGMYLGMLLSLGFVAEENDPDRSVVYRTTEAGMDFLCGCLKMQESLRKLPFEVKSRV